MQQFLFPFKRVKRDSRIIIYGAGKVGQTYLHQVRLTQYCVVACIVDRDFQKFEQLDIRVIAPAEIKNEAYDYIVVAHGVPAIGNEIVANLIDQYMIPKERIVYERNLIQPVAVYRGEESIVLEGKWAFEQRDRYAIAIKLGGGIGDFIVRKNSVMKLACWHADLSLDIFVEPGKFEFTKTLFSDISCVNQIVPSMQEYSVQVKNYLAAFDFGLMLNVDFISDEKVERLPLELKHKIIIAYEASKTYNLSGDWKACAIHYARCEKDGLNCYTSYKRYGLYNENAILNTVPMLEQYRKSFEELNLHNYITLNYGWDNRLGSMRPSAKVWPLEYYSMLATMIKRQYPNLQIVQIGMTDSSRIDNCDRYVFGESLEEVKYVLQGAMLHIDCEGGMVHLATQLGTKCIVIFGPTPVFYYGYKDNINIVSAMCKNCYWLVPDYISCYRKLEKPECMYSILPERVAGEVVKYLEQYAR